MTNLIKKLLSALPEDAPDGKIHATAEVLEAMTFEPILLIPTPGFVRMKKADVRNELVRILESGTVDVSDVTKSKHIELLLYYYDLLCRLRLDEPEAWDTVNELYEDD